MKKKVALLLIASIVSTSLSLPTWAEDIISENMVVDDEPISIDDSEIMLDAASEDKAIQEMATYGSTTSGNSVIDSKTYNFSKLKITVVSKNQIYYTGRGLKPTITVENKGKVKETLKEGVDYTVQYKNNIHAGTATVVVTGIGKYAWKKNVKKVKFRIKPKKIDKDKKNPRVSVSVNGNTEYKGRGLKPSLYVFDLDTGEAITNYNYKVSYKNNKNVKTAGDKNPPTARVTFRNDYRGKAMATFDITVAMLNDYNVSITTADVKDTGKEITAENIKTRIKFRNYTLKRGRDYDVTYKRDMNNYKQYFNVTFKGNFVGSATGNFNIYK